MPGQTDDADRSLIASLAEAYRRAPELDPITVFAENMAADCVFEDWVGDVRVSGADEIKTRVYEPYIASYRDCSYEIDASVSDGGRLVMSGVFRGWKLRTRGNETELSWKFRDLYEVAHGRVMRFSVASDTLEVDRQLQGELA